MRHTISSTITRSVCLLLGALCLATSTIKPAAAQSCPEFATPVATAHLTDPRWTGLSGIAASRRNFGVLWLHNDGGSGEFYAASEDGRLLATFTLAGVADLEAQGQGIVDIEDIAVGPGPDGLTYIYLGDIGGNRYDTTNRATVRVFRVPEPQVNTAEATTEPVVLSNYETFTLAYGNNERRDAESLMVDTNGDLYVVTKAAISGTSYVFRKAAPHSPSTTTTMTRVATLQFGSGNLPGNRAATAGDISVSGNQAIIRTYDHAFLWVKPAGMSWQNVFATVAPCTVPAEEGSGYEAIAFDTNGNNYYDTYESTNLAETLNLYARLNPPPARYYLYLPQVQHASR